MLFFIGKAPLLGELKGKMSCKNVCPAAGEKQCCNRSRAKEGCTSEVNPLNWRNVCKAKHLKQSNAKMNWRSLFCWMWNRSEVYLKYEERHRKQTVHFPLRSEGKHGDNLQTSKRLLQNQRQCGIVTHPSSLGQELMDLC